MNIVLKPLARSILALTALAAFSFDLAGCTKVETQSGESSGLKNSWSVPHTFRFAAAEDLVGLNTLFATQAVANYLAEFWGAYLIRTDRFGEPTVPELCTEIPSKANGGISPDGKTLTWHLRKGVKWSDGSDFSADDVVWSTQQVLNKNNNVVSTDGWDQITKIDEPDKYTVVYHLKAPYGAFSVTFFSSAGANPVIMPKHAFDLTQNNINSAPYNSLPIGIGPFKVEQWKRGDSVTFVPNQYYFRGQPKMQKIVYELITDRDVVLNQLRAHALDAWLPVSPHYWPEIAGIDGYVRSATPSFTYDHIDLNTQHPPLADPVVRRALRMAIDRPNIMQKIEFGIYDLQEGVVPQASQIFYDPIPKVPFDVAGANKLLDAAGWKRGPDGVRSKNGVRLSLDWASSAGTHDADEEIELIRQTWSQIGVSFNLKHYLASLFFAPVASGGILYSGKFDVSTYAWGGDPNEDLSNLFACYRIPPAGQNVPRWCDPAATAAIDRAKVQYDRKARVPDETAAQNIIFNQAPTIVLWSRKELRAYNSDVKHWDWITNPESPFDNFMNVDV